jgi:hypothetical protein
MRPQSNPIVCSWTEPVEDLLVAAGEPGGVKILQARIGLWSMTAFWGVTFPRAALVYQRGRNPGCLALRRKKVWQ